MDPFIVGIRFQRLGKVYHFDASAQSDLRVGDHVIVETTRGKQLGEIIQTYESPPPPPPEGSWKPVERRATARDLVLRKMWQEKELEATINCRAKAAEMGIQGVKFVTSEFSYDGSRLAFIYSSEQNDKLDLNHLRSAMQRQYTRSKVEMRQVGPRDVAKLLGGMGACGLETRCCSKFLTDFSPVSIKMAKEQGISLTPNEITGMCGRLRCCLVYEYEQYVEARKVLPKRGKRVISAMGEGKVVDVYPLKQSVMVLLDDNSTKEFMKHELQPWDELEALRRKSEAPCDRHENGGCDCGKDKAASETTTQSTQAISPASQPKSGEARPYQRGRGPVSDYKEDEALTSWLEEPAQPAPKRSDATGQAGEGHSSGKKRRRGGRGRGDRPEGTPRNTQTAAPANQERSSSVERRPNDPDRPGWQGNRRGNKQRSGNRPPRQSAPFPSEKPAPRKRPPADIPESTEHPAKPESTGGSSSRKPRRNRNRNRPPKSE